MFHFELQENEKILHIYRQSETALFKPVIILFILIYFPWFFFIKYELASSYARLLFFWTILVFIYAVNKYLLWLLNTYMVTDKRLIYIRYKSLFSKEVLESPLSRILNVSFTTEGFWQSLFSSGSVQARVEGLNEPIVLKNVSHPAQIKDMLWKMHLSFGRKPEREVIVDYGLGRKPPQAL